MRWASILSGEERVADAVDDAVRRLRDELGDAPDLLLAYVSPQYGEDAARAFRLLREIFPDAQLAGGSAAGLVGSGDEWEGRLGLSLTGACLPKTDVRIQHLPLSDLPSPDAGPGEWRAAIGDGSLINPAFIIFADPFTLGLDRLVAGLDFAFATCPKVGGLASGALHPGEHLLCANDLIEDSGAVIIALDGGLVMDTIVAQGCRPIGQAMRITACEGNTIKTLEGESPLQHLRALADTLSGYDRSLLQHSLFVGVQMDALNAYPDRGDFLIRNIMHFNRESGEAVVAADLTPGLIVQFHLRDRRTAEEDLHLQFGRYIAQEVAREPKGAMLFSCMGRGMHLFGEHAHDTRAFTDAFGELPIGGFFCNGEIGPVGGETRVHGYTSVFAVFSEA